MTDRYTTFANSGPGRALATELAKPLPAAPPVPRSEPRWQGA